MPKNYLESGKTAMINNTGLFTDINNDVRGVCALYSARPSNRNSESALQPKMMGSSPKLRNLFILFGSFLFVPLVFLVLLVVSALLASIVGNQEN